MIMMMMMMMMMMMGVMVVVMICELMAVDDRLAPVPRMIRSCFGSSFLVNIPGKVRPGGLRPH